MLLSDIISYVIDRTGEGGIDDILLREIRNELRNLWLTQDTYSSIWEVDVIPSDQRVITLPWYVWQVKAVRRYVGSPQTLLTPRRAYQPFNERQSTYEWRELGRRPLFGSVVNAGQFTFRLKQNYGASFNINIRGADDFGVNTVETVAFSAADVDKTTSGAYSDLITISTSEPLSVDIAIYDCTGTLAGVLAAGQTEAVCIVIQVSDIGIVPVNLPCNVFTVLYKEHPPVLSTVNDSVSDEVGIVLQNSVTAARLSVRESDIAQRRSAAFGSKASALNQASVRRQDEGTEQRVGLQASPFTTLSIYTI